MGPLMFPVNGPISQQFGENPANYLQFGFTGHEGIDWAVPAGSPVQVVADGRVLNVSSTGPYGLHVLVDHGWGISIYAHLSRVVVQKGEGVTGGMRLGYSGSTGNSTGPHLHLTLKIHGQKTPGYPDGIVDPLPYLSGQKDTTADERKNIYCVAVDVLNVRLTPGGRDVGDLLYGECLVSAGEGVKTAGELWRPVVLWVADRYLKKGADAC